MFKTVQSFYSEIRACIKGKSGMNDWFGVEVGLRQGCEMSPWLFNIHMNGVVRGVNTRVWGRELEMIGQGGNVWRVNQLSYADDTVLIEDSEEKLR